MKSDVQIAKIIELEEEDAVLTIEKNKCLYTIWLFQYVSWNWRSRRAISRWIKYTCHSSWNIETYKIVYFYNVSV